jgi:hypothetical protein
MVESVRNRSFLMSYPANSECCNRSPRSSNGSGTAFCVHHTPNLRLERIHAQSPVIEELHAIMVTCGTPKNDMNPTTHYEQDLVSGSRESLLSTLTQIDSGRCPRRVQDVNLIADDHDLKILVNTHGYQTSELQILSDEESGAFHTSGRRSVKPFPGPARLLSSI